ncbi:PEGA domain-containing protein [Sandaracinus amylolyticus]|uniref:PEGA domain-containing protein n=1 Tax=Sandaracinus amylolyticus TaxID=927083 RepID=A0A0F6VZS4_9BACT|nr:carboxypeptidase regulatory-like domain-containing protein [Sandaracinus amylolyticus]AKF03818.1 hypothetical protein DB32_000967 [Sandaracinus amylolyticus]
MRHALGLRFLSSLLFAAALVTSVPAAAQDASVIVLGLTSIEGDDEYARNLTGAIRNQASRVPGWQVSDREVTLAQMSLAHGCGDVPDVECLRQIAATLNAQRLLYGTVRRQAGDFHLTLSLFDAETGHIDRTVEQTLSSRRTDIDDLREPARTVVTQLSGPVTGALRIASNAPGATVSVDGEVAGTTDGEGGFSMPAIAVGEHAIEVSAPGRDPWTGTVTIARDTEMTLDAELAESTGGGQHQDGGDGPSINWAGIALIAAGALAFGGTIYSWARLEAINSDPQYRAYTESFRMTYDPMRGGNPPSTYLTNCSAAAGGDTLGGRADAGAASSVADLCSEGDTLEVLQYVFLGVAVAAAGTGAIFLATGVGESGGSEDEAPSVTVLPSFSPEGGRITARVRF